MSSIFKIDPDAARYIRKHCGGAVTIVLDFQPMMGGGWKCPAARDVSGSYVPRLLAGPPDEGGSYLFVETGNSLQVKIFYPPRLTAKPFADAIRIRLKKFMFLKWLELEGARSLVCAPAEE